MKPTLFSFMLLLTATRAFAQAPTLEALHIGETVTIAAPFFIDDGRVGEVVGFNDTSANVQYSQVKTGDDGQPTLVTTTAYWNRNQIRPSVVADVPFHPGQMAKVTAIGFPETNIIGTVTATDGKNVILQYNTDPTTQKSSIWTSNRLAPASHADFSVLAGDVIRIAAPGFMYSNINSKVLFNNGARIWISYTDGSGRDQSDVISSQAKFAVVSKGLRVDFDIAALPMTLQTLAGLVYGAPQNFFNVVGSHLDSDIPMDGNALEAGNSISARAFVELALAPVIQGIDSDMFKQAVLPIYQQKLADLAKLPVRSLSDIEISAQVSKAACLVMRASLESMLQVVGDLNDKTALTQMHTQVGLLAAGNSTRSELASFLTGMQANTDLMNRLSADYHTSTMAVAFNQVIDYLKAKN